jgi:selenocysteine-specific elongation factor
MHVVGTAGHVDHGKSTLVTALTGIDPDRFEEEKRRGLTIDLGFAWCTLPSGREIGIVDVPGHERFIRNMLAGVGSIDAAIFVVAADEGWMPQSAEHLQILDFLEISGGVVALTKSDTVNAEELELVREDIRERLRGTSLRDARVVAVSAPAGAGLDELREALDELLAVVPQAPDLGRPRLFVDRSFSIVGAGTVVTGTLAGGALRVGDEIEIVPSGSRARIRSLQTHRTSVEKAVPGSRVAANLVGLERSDITRGDALVRPGQWHVTRTFAARLVASDDVRHPLTARGAYELYLGTADFRCRVKLLEDADDNIVAVNTPSGLAPALRPGSSALVQLYYGRGLPVGIGDRFVIRDVGRRETVAGGVVLDSDPGTIRRGDKLELERMREREGLAGADLAKRILTERGALRSKELQSLAGVVAGAIEGLDATLPSGYVIDSGYRSELEGRIVDAVRAHHESQPLSPSMSTEDLARATRADRNVVDDLVTSLQNAGKLSKDGAGVRLPDRGSVLAPDQRALADRALAVLRAADTSPPSLKEVGLSMDIAKAIERAGELVIVNPDIAYPSDVWTTIEHRVVDLIAAGGPASVSQVRDAIGTTRKYAVPLLERLDATGITHRQGDVRVLGPRGRELAQGEK